MKHLIIVLIVQIVLTASAVAAGNAQAGKEKSATCVACHGENGISATPMFPNIAGQYEDYIYHALNSYKDGGRNNAIMVGIASALSDQDMKDLAAYYSSMDGLRPFGLPEKSN